MKNGILHTLACIGLTLFLAIALSNPVLAADNVLTWDPIDLTGFPQVVGTDIRRKQGTCGDGQTFTTIVRVANGVFTYTDVIDETVPANVGTYAYVARTTDGTTTSLLSNCAEKVVVSPVPTYPAPSNLQVQ